MSSKQINKFRKQIAQVISLTKILKLAAPLLI